MARITYTATDERNGETYTRTTDTMAYSHAAIGGGVTFHTSLTLARKAASPRGAIVAPAIPTAISGRASLGEFIGHPHADAIDALIAAKNAPRVKTGPTIRATLGEPRPAGRDAAAVDAADAANRERNRRAMDAAADQVRADAAQADAALDALLPTVPAAVLDCDHPTATGCDRCAAAVARAITARNARFAAERAERVARDAAAAADRATERARRYGSKGGAYDRTAQDARAHAAEMADAARVAAVAADWLPDDDGDDTGDLVTALGVALRRATDAERRADAIDAAAAERIADAEQRAADAERRADLLAASRQWHADAFLAGDD